MVAALPPPGRNALLHSANKKSQAGPAAKMNTTYRQIPQKSYDLKDGGPLFSIIDASLQVSRDLLGIVLSRPPPGVPAHWLLDYSRIDVYLLAL
jgi:hypothetical protein